MTIMNQTDCFDKNIKFWKFLGVWPTENLGRYYVYYSKAFVFTFQILYILLFTLNFYFIPRTFDSFVEQMIFYFTEIAVSSKVLTFYFMHDKIVKIFESLRGDVFQPATDEDREVIEKAKKFTLTYWKIVAGVSFTSNVSHLLSPLIVHLILHVDLELPVCSYSFLPEELKKKFIYLLFFYQGIGLHFHVLYNLNIDTFFLGLLILIIAHLKILYGKLENLTKGLSPKDDHMNSNRSLKAVTDDKELNTKFYKAILYYNAINRFRLLIQDVFSVALFFQFGLASCIICICAFKITQPAPWQYYVFLATYMSVMMLQIMVPCWFGARVIERSQALSFAIYTCDWIPRSRRFKSSKRIFVERVSHPLTITGWKFFPLSLVTFTSIMNLAYSFFTLLRHMQFR